MRVPVGDLRAAVGNRERCEADIDLRALPAAGGDVQVEGPVKVAAELVNAGGEIVAEVRARATAALSCARCLAAVEVPLDVRFRQVFRPGLPPAEGANEPGDEEIAYFQGDAIDLTPAVVENLALAVPMKALCRATCRGLCPTCGKDLNQGPCQCPVPLGDPRLAVLGDLLRDPADAED